MEKTGDNEYNIRVKDVSVNGIIVHGLTSGSMKMSVYFNPYIDSFVGPPVYPMPRTAFNMITSALG